MHQHSVCVACGPAPVSHVVEKFSIAFSWFVRPYEWCMEQLWRLVRPVFMLFALDWLALPAYRFLAAIGFGKLIRKPDNENGGRAKVFWAEANRRGYHMYEFRFFNRSNEFFVITGPDLTRAFISLPRPRRYETGLDWIDDKGTMRKKFVAANIPVAHGAACFSRACAQELFTHLEKPVVVKPVIGSRSRHTTMHITTPDQLSNAIEVAKQLSPWFVIEEELTGMVYRATVIGGKLVGVLRREPPHVVGNGKLTVRELLEKENQNKKRNGEIFNKIPAGIEAEDELKLQNLTWHSIPTKSQTVFLHQKISRTNGATNTDVTDETHPDNRELFARVAEVASVSMVGIDFIIPDITKSWKKQAKSGVIECNSLPFIDLHHFPFAGKARNAAGELFKTVFPMVPLRVNSNVVRRRRANQTA